MKLSNHIAYDNINIKSLTPSCHRFSCALRVRPTAITTSIRRSSDRRTAATATVTAETARRLTWLASSRGRLATPRRVPRIRKTSRERIFFRPMLLKKWKRRRWLPPPSPPTRRRVLDPIAVQRKAYFTHSIKVLLWCVL